MNNVIIQYLGNQGYNPHTGYYDKIKLWINLWKGKTQFHQYKVTYGDMTFEKEMYSLGMPQRIAQDWASICWAEKDQIVLQGTSKEYLDNKLKELKFNVLMPYAIEKAVYSGTCGAIVRVKNMKLFNQGQENILTTDKFSKYDLILMTADQIVPLRTEHGKIIDCAFISEHIIENKIGYYIEIHELVKRRNEQGEEYETYRIKNKYINSEGKEVTMEKVVPEYYTMSNIPLFSILTPPADNPFEEEANGLGMAMYGNSIDQLYAVDIAYHNFVMDYYLGGKKMFYNKKLCQQDDKGNIIYPTDVQKQQWQIVGDEMENANENSLMHEYNPSLRINENTEGLQFMLDLLSFKVGLGAKYYQFNGGSVVTATQYAGERQDMVVNARKFRNNVDEFVINICRGILLLGRILFKQTVDENTEIRIINEDGFLISTEELKEKYLQEINMGVRSKLSYMIKFMGMTEEEAIKELERVDSEGNINNLEIGD